MQRHRFDPLPRKIFMVEGIFPLELTWVLTPLPQNSFKWEYRPWSSPCWHAFHHTDSKDPDIHVLDRWMPATKTTQHASSTKTKCDYLNGWIKKMVTYTKISPKMVIPQRYNWGTQKKKEKKNCFNITSSSILISWQIQEKLNPPRFAIYWPCNLQQRSRPLEVECLVQATGD